MPYTKTTWTDNITPLSAANLNKMEQGINTAQLYAADTATTDSYTITLDGVTAYTEGMIVTFKAKTANTTACTLNINNLGAKGIKKNVSSDMETGDILANDLVQVQYDGTNFQMIGKLANAVTAASVSTLTNKTLTAPKITSASYIADSGGNELIKFPATVASAVNEVTVSNAATVNPPTIEATGGDTNIDLALKAKGTGLIRILNSIKMALSAGFIADTNGNELIEFPATVASAVNQVKISNAAAGSGPSIEASGADTNIDLNLKSKGTGIVKANGNTLWHAGNDGAGSGLDADLVQGVNISYLPDTVDNLSYDLYELYLEQYYLGEVSNAPDTNGVRALTFDGFINTNNIDAASSAVIDTGAKEARSSGYPWVTDPGRSVFTSAYIGSYQGCASQAIVDGSYGNSVQINGYSNASGAYACLGMQLDLGSVQAITNCKAWVYLDSYNNMVLPETQYSVDGVTWTKNASTQFLTSTTYSSVGVTLNNPTNVSARYLRFLFGCVNGSSTGVFNGNYIEEVEVNTASGKISFAYVDTTLYSKPKAIPFTAVKAELYISVNEANGAIVPKVTFDGTNYLSGSIVSSRADPKFTGFTEKQYEFIGNGNNIKLQALLDAVAAGTPKIKRYGLYLYEA